MVPRTEVDFLDADMTIGDAARYVMQRAHSRYPVIASDVDDVVGVVHVRDLLTALLTDPESEKQPVRRIARPVPLLPSGKPLLDALSEMRAQRAHLAVVVDEYGGTDGIVTMEDILEELVGDIEDEYDPQARPAADDSEFDGLLHREELADRVRDRAARGPVRDAGRVRPDPAGAHPPARATRCATGGHRFTVTEMDGMRVARVRVDEAAPQSGTCIADRPRGKHRRTAFQVTEVQRFLKGAPQAALRSARTAGSPGPSALPRARSTRGSPAVGSTARSPQRPYPPRCPRTGRALGSAGPNLRVCPSPEHPTTSTTGRSSTSRWSARSAPSPASTRGRCGSY